MSMLVLITMLIMGSVSKSTSKLTMALSLVILNLNTPSFSLTKPSSLLIMDSVSFWMLQLTVWLTFVILFLKTNNPSGLFKLTILMGLFLFLTFTIWNFFMFYILFEISLILVILIMMGWGYQPERVESALYMTIMTVMASIPFLVSNMTNSTSLSFWFLNLNLNLWDYLSFMAIFMMKMPTMFLHIWLPKVHVESPVHGSMLLASILLKLGSYGMIRTLPTMSVMNNNASSCLVAFGLWSMVALSMVCIAQSDIKTIIAYSSVVHMSMVFMTIVLNKPSSVTSSLMIMLGHGMCSSGMFYLANILYKSTKSRSILMNKGLLKMNPTNLLMWFCLCMANAPMPPSINVMGEFLGFKTIINWVSTTLALVMIIMLVSGLYSIFLFYSPSHGSFTKTAVSSNISSGKTSLLLTLHLTPLAILTMKPQVLMI